MFGLNRKRRQGMFDPPEGYETPPIMAQEAPMAQMQHGTGLFGQGAPKKPGFNDAGGWGEKIMAIGGTLRDDDGGRSAQAFFDNKQFRVDQAAQAQAAEAKRLAERQDWQWKQEWERANPKPVNNDTINDFEWFKGLSDEDRQTYQEMNPEYRQGPDGRFYRIDTGGTAPPSKPVGKLSPIGGPSQPAAGGFR